MQAHPDPHVLEYTEMLHMGRQWYPYHTITLNLDGGFRYETRRSCYTIIPGSVLLGGEGEEYANCHETVDTFHGTCVEFSDESLAEIAAVDGGVAADFSLKPAALPPSTEFTAIHQLLRQALADPAFSVRLDELAYLLASRIFKVMAENPKHGRGGKASLARRADRERIQQAVQFMIDNLARSVKLEEIAGAAGLSAYHFLRLFKRVTGLTPHQYLIFLRMRQATKLLNETSWSTIRIAQEVGFCDLATFSAAYKSRVGLTPTVMRSASERITGRSEGFMPVQMFVH